jgi:hypothetical protein
MKYCIYCGTELRGMKKFCIVCGKKQDKLQKAIETEAPEKPKHEDKEEMGDCVRCGDDTEKKCFFCDDYVCRAHYTRMQANVSTFAEMKEYTTQEETKRINEGWRGFIVYACPKCLRLKVGKKLTDDETVQINTVDECSWYKIESQAM